MTGALLDVTATHTATPAGRLLRGDRQIWQRRYVLLMLGLDVVLLAAVTLVAVLVRFGDNPDLRGLAYTWVAFAISVTWLVALAHSHCYQPRSLLRQNAGLFRVGKATVEVFAAVALVSFLARAPVSRSYLLIVFPVGLVALLTNRIVVYAVLQRARAAGHAQHRVLVVGAGAALLDLARTFALDPRHGHRVVATCQADGTGLVLEGVPQQGARLAPALSIAAAVRQSRADTVAVSPEASANEQGLRDICYALEGMRIDVVVTPAFTDVAGTRISIRPVAGLPLLHLDEPELDGVHKLVKSIFDRAAATAGLLLLTPVLAVVCLSIRLTSPGPVIFKQVRVGRDGRTFRVWKFRSMFADAEARFEELRRFNEHEGPLFKMRDDPRITPVGRFLRKWSLDELPQLVNVVKGDMSLVGPRPPLPAEVANYDGHAHRRLLVKPGITGLWQVSGRADLEWDEAVRLDLAYVEGWSLGFDISILLRTVLAVLKSSGAY